MPSLKKGTSRLEERGSSPGILVTGGAGFIGRHLLGRLVQQGYRRITVLDNLHRSLRPDTSAAQGHVQFIQGDIRNPETVARAMRGVDVVFHLAAQANVLGAVHDPRYCASTNVGGTASIVEQACFAGVRRLVFTSSREVYGDPDALPVHEGAPLRPKNTYGMSKVAGEMCCQMCAGKLETVILRLANVYGPGDSGRVIPLFVESALSGRPLTVFGGRQILDFVHVSRVVEALVNAGLSGHVDGPVNVGSGKPTTVAELATRVLKLTGSGSLIRVLPSRQVEVGRFVADIARAKSLLHLKQPDDPLEGLPEQIAWTAAGRRSLTTPDLRNAAV